MSMKSTPTAKQMVELVGGPRCGESYIYEYTNNPTFWVLVQENDGHDYLYRMCNDGKFRLEKHADEFDAQMKREKRAKKRGK